MAVSAPASGDNRNMKLTMTKDMQRLRAAAAERITELAARNRAAYATPGKDGVYITKLSEARLWLADGQPEDLAQYPYLQAETGITAPTTYELAQIWLNRNDLWVMVLAPAIERREQIAKRAIDRATSPAQLDAIVAAWESV